MTDITDIININISRETAAVTQTNFNVPMFLATFANFKERGRFYTSLKGVLADFASTSNVYIAASKLFGQELKPANIYIGRRNVPGATVSVATVTNTTEYSLKISDVTYAITSGASATAILIAGALKTAYDVAPVAGVTMTNNGDGTLTITSSVPEWSIVAPAGDLLIATAPSVESWVDAYAAVSTASSKWYVLHAETHLEADILALAGAVEASRKMYITSTSDAGVLTTVTTDVASKLKALSYFRTALIWSATANTQFPECAWSGSQLQEQPGSNTWNFKVLSGVTVSSMSPTEAINAHNKNVTTYEELGGLNKTLGATTAGGEWIDTMIFIDWLQARMVERVWFRLGNAKKIPYTQAGALILETEVRAQLSEGVRVGGLAPTPKPFVITPDVLTIAPNSRALRIFEGMKFEARLAGAIHFVKIQGTVTV